MKTAIISDIHANLEALTSVFKDIESKKCDQIYCLGDVLGYGSNPKECLELVKENCSVTLMGNHEYAILGLSSTDKYNDAAKRSTEWTQKVISDFEMAIIADFDLEHINNQTRYVHASPFEPDNWHYILAPQAALQGFKAFSERICFYGHTHIPQIFTEIEGEKPRAQFGHDFLPDPENRYLINIGSVGQPRDNDPRACYAIFDDEEYEVLFNRVEYDISQTQSKMSEANIPTMLINRLSVGK